MIVSFRSGPVEIAADLDARALLQKLQVRLRLLGEIFVTRDAARRRLPARQLLIQRLDPFERPVGGRHILDFLAVQPIPDAYRDLVQLVQHVQLGDHQRIEPIDHRRCSAAAAHRTSRSAADGPVTAPYSFPCGAIWSPAASWSRWETVPPPTRVMYALETPITPLNPRRRHARAGAGSARRWRLKKSRTDTFHDRYRAWFPARLRTAPACRRGMASVSNLAVSHTSGRICAAQSFISDRESPV